jgi:hypothetical protein
MNHLPFGAFNPRFYGVSMFLGSDDDRLDILDRYGQARDPAEWSRKNRAPSLAEISTISASDHEFRHFHDFLLSPLGTITMGMRMQASVSGFQAMKALKGCRGRFVPVPLIRWIEWDPVARQRWIDSTGRYFGIGRSDDIVALPHAPDVAHLKFQIGAQAVPDSLPQEQQLGAYALPAAQAYAAMQIRRKRRVSMFDLEVSADDVFEAVAHLVQLQAVWTGQGEEQTNVFLHFVLTSSEKHLMPLQVLWHALQRSSHVIGPNRAVELLTWMLLGSYEQSDSSGHPASRYFQVLQHLFLSSNDDVFIGRMPAAELFDRLDALTGSPPWRDNLRSAGASAERRSSAYSNLNQTLKGGYFDALFAVAAAWHNDQASARQTFLGDPESLANPLRYLTEERFPPPFLEIRQGDRLHVRDRPMDSPNFVAIAIDEEGKNVLSYIGKQPSQTTKGLDNVRTARILTHMVDFLFADEPVVDLYEHWCRSQIQNLIGKELFSVY